MAEPLTLSQKILLGSLYGFLVLMVIFSLMATKNFGEEGYTKCIEKNVQKHGDPFLKKARGVSNCCVGAGGQFFQNSEGFTCVFE